jgi:hypothetical protein
MMHIAAHCAHLSAGAMPLHMHIPPIGDVQYVQHPRPIELCRSNSDLSRRRRGIERAQVKTLTSRVGGYFHQAVARACASEGSP